tara:strand:- start:18647 stop:18988 length:342 start_codon:yes stop_codon:yes gene_type:complete
LHKLIALISRLPNLSKDEFAEYYEHHHVPLIKKLFPMISQYKRNFLSQDPKVEGNVGPANFDVITEFWFHDDHSLDEFWSKTEDPNVVKLIMEDESHFIDSARTQIYVVKEHE